MRRHRWPAITPPSDRGVRVLAPAPIVAEKDLALELSAVTAFASGLLPQLAMRVTGIRADFARFETRPLTDPQDWSAQWSYLVVRVRADDLDGPAHPLHRSEPPFDESGPYRTTPMYWISSYTRRLGGQTIRFLLDDHKLRATGTRKQRTDCRFQSVAGALWPGPVRCDLGCAGAWLSDITRRHHESSGLGSGHWIGSSSVRQQGGRGRSASDSVECTAIPVCRVAATGRNTCMSGGRRLPTGVR